MSAKPNYFKIGLFIIIAVTLIAITVVIWGSGKFTERKIYFETYFDSSVSGLIAGAPVEFRGVRIGQVQKITFISDEYPIQDDPLSVSKYGSFVMVLCSIPEENLPELEYYQRRARLTYMITQGLRLRLNSEILTGIAYLEADYLDPNRFPVLEIAWEPKHLYIPSAPSVLSTLEDSLDRIFSRLEKIDTEKIGLALQDILVSLDRALRDANLPEVMKQLNETLYRINRLIATRKPEIEQTLENLKEISANLADLTETLKQHPSELIFSQPPPKSEALK
jgi:phospholipid/cholesterol/gamma-HCH transport system substrate-binding protein/paraquat-inducible protein B